MCDREKINKVGSGATGGVIIGVSTWAFLGLLGGPFTLGTFAISTLGGAAIGGVAGTASYYYKKRNTECNEYDNCNNYNDCDDCEKYDRCQIYENTMAVPYPPPVHYPPETNLTSQQPTNPPPYSPEHQPPSYQSLYPSLNVNNINPPPYNPAAIAQ